MVDIVRRWIDLAYQEEFGHMPKSKCHGADTCNKMAEAMSHDWKKVEGKDVTPEIKDMVAAMLTSLTTGRCYWCKRPIR